MLFTAAVSLAAPLGDLERLRPLTRRAALLGLGASIATSGSQRPVFALELDPDYPGTAVERMQAVRQRAASLTPSELSRDWSSFVRPRLLWAAGMRDVRDAAPGQGYTGHAFNDAIHVDATAMLDGDALNDGRVRGIAIGNRLGPGIAAASLTELGPGGSWSTCQATSSPLSSPRPAEDSGVAHLQVTPSPHRRTAAPPHRRTAAPPHRRTAAPLHRRAAAHRCTCCTCRSARSYRYPPCPTACSFARASRSSSSGCPTTTAVSCWSTTTAACSRRARQRAGCPRSRSARPTTPWWPAPSTAARPRRWLGRCECGLGLRARCGPRLVSH